MSGNYYLNNRNIRPKLSKFCDVKLDLVVQYSNGHSFSIYVHSNV